MIPVSKEAENSDQNKRRQENDQPQLGTDRDDKDDQNSKNESEALSDSTASSKLVSTNTVALTTTVSTVALTREPESNNGTVKSNDLDKCTNVKKTDIRETPVKNESGTITKPNVMEHVPSLVIGDVGESFKASALSGMKESHKRNEKEKPFIAANNILSKENLAFEKRVRFSLEGNKTSSLLEADTKKQELTKEDPQLLFSDEEEGERECGSIDEDVSQRINRIQNLLRSDRLRTNRKRKNPVV